MGPKLTLQDLRPGVTLGDAHYLGARLSLETTVQKRLAEGLHCCDDRRRVTIDRQDSHELLDAMLQQVTGDPYFRSTNKLVYVLHFSDRQLTDRLVVGWSYDGCSMTIAGLEISLQPREASATA